MSRPSCDACTDLRERAPEFVMNGVTDNVANSLINNRGVTWNSNNCDDLQDVNDCLIGRKVQEIESYDVCDWKEFMSGLGGNLYETLKAMIMNECGIWSTMCESFQTMLSIINHTPGRWCYMTPTPEFQQKWSAHFFNGAGDQIPVDPTPILQAEIRTGSWCGSSGRIGVWSFWPGESVPPPPGWQYHVDIDEPVPKGEPLGTIRKDAVVPTYMTEAQWNSLMRGFNQSPLVEYSYNGEIGMMYAILKGYIVDEGGEWNVDLKDEYGEGVGVLFAGDVVGSQARMGSGTYMSEQRYVNVYWA